MYNWDPIKKRMEDEQEQYLQNQEVKLRMQGQVLKENEKGYCSEHSNDKKAKQLYCWWEESVTGLDVSSQPPLFLKPKQKPEQGPNSLGFYEGWEGEKCRTNLKLAEAGSWDVRKASLHFPPTNTSEWNCWRPR